MSQCLGKSTILHHQKIAVPPSLENINTFVPTKLKFYKMKNLQVKRLESLVTDARRRNSNKIDAFSSGIIRVCMELVETL